jgi:hypothetical protein
VVVVAHPHDPVVELGVVERGQVYLGRHVQHPALDRTRDQVAEDLLAFPLHRRRERLARRDQRHHRDPRQHVGQRAALRGGDEQRVERFAGGQQQRHDGDGPDGLQHGRQHEVPPAGLPCDAQRHPDQGGQLPYAHPFRAGRRRGRLLGRLHGRCFGGNRHAPKCAPFASRGGKRPYGFPESRRERQRLERGGKAVHRGAAPREPAERSEAQNY